MGHGRHGEFSCAINSRPFKRHGRTSIFTLEFGFHLAEDLSPFPQNSYFCEPFWGKSTIHHAKQISPRILFLLPPPPKKPPNMAFFSPRHTHECRTQKAEAYQRKLYNPMSLYISRVLGGGARGGGEGVVGGGGGGGRKARSGGGRKARKKEEGAWNERGERVSYRSTVGELYIRHKKPPPPQDNPRVSMNGGIDKRGGRGGKKIGKKKGVDEHCSICFFFFLDLFIQIYMRGEGGGFHPGLNREENGREGEGECLILLFFLGPSLSTPPSIGERTTNLKVGPSPLGFTSSEYHIIPFPSLPSPPREPTSPCK